MTRDLFGGWELWREWGRCGSPGTLRREIYEQEAAAISAVRRIVRRRLRHGYAERGHRVIPQDAVSAAAEAPKQGVFAPAGTLGLHRALRVYGLRRGLSGSGIQEMQ
jgi:predicted DNA-binding WGR domain protein